MPLADLLEQLAAGSDPLEVAYGHNYLFEERVASTRQEGYEAALGLPSASLKAWRNRHRDYVYRKVRVIGQGETPETFTQANAEALLSGLDENQWIVRLENLDSVIARKGSATALSTIQDQLDLFRKGDDQADALNARRFLEDLCETWNTAVRRDRRPSFAAFLDEVEEDLEATDWPNRLRDRLGLSHYDVLDGGRPIPVALMRYRVEAVLEAAGDAEDRAFAVPTVLDGELNTHFFPSPAEASYGRTLGLLLDEDCERLVAEILHWRIDYTPDHIYKVGLITSSIPPYSRGAAFARLRDQHLFCLRYESNRNNFGQKILEGADG